jgi:hypothetical protein
MSSMIPLTILSLDRWNCQELSSALIHVLAHFQRTCSQIYFRFSSYLLRKPHLFLILTAIGWFIVNIQSDLFWNRCLERQAFGTLSPSKSIKGSNYGEFLKDKNVLLCTRLYKYAPNLESLLIQQYVCILCTLWSDLIIHEFLLVFIAYLELWSSVKPSKPSSSESLWNNSARSGVILVSMFDNGLSSSDHSTSESTVLSSYG